MFTTYYFVNCLRLQRYVVFCKVQLKFVSCVFLNVSCTIKLQCLCEKRGFAAANPLFSPLFICLLVFVQLDVENFIIAT